MQDWNSSTQVVHWRIEHRLHRLSSSTSNNLSQPTQRARMSTVDHFWALLLDVPTSCTGSDLKASLGINHIGQWYPAERTDHPPVSGE